MASQLSGGIHLPIGGTMPELSERLQAHRVLDFGDTCLRGVGQVRQAVEVDDVTTPEEHLARSSDQRSGGVGRAAMPTAGPAISNDKEE